MTDRVHIYTAAGRCIGSMQLGRRTVAPNVPVTDTTLLQRQLLANGMRLSIWNDVERAGLIVSDGDTYIVRIKKAELARSMRPGGAEEAIAAIRDGGLEVALVTGLPLAA